MEQAVDRVLDKYIGEYSEEEPDYIALLQEIQEEFRYLPPEALHLCSHKLSVPLNQLYSIATFYSCFSLVPRGKYEIHICMGTACHVRGAPGILERMSQKLNLAPGQTSDDLMYTLETVNCLGACAMAPLVTVNQVYHGNMKVSEVNSLLEKEGKGKDD